MTRAVVSVVLCIVAVAIGVVTAVTSARNRATGADLDRRQHWCETLERQNQLQRASNGREEWLLLYGEAPEAPPSEGPPADSLAPEQ